MLERSCALACTLLIAAAQTGAQTRPQVMIVGTYHMANPGQDVANVTADDVLSPKRQAEIQRLVDLLAAFRPTRVALEYEPSRDSAMNARYRAYVGGSQALSRNESEQVGFRLAKAMNLPRVHGIDFQKPLDIMGVFQFAGANGFGAFVAETQREMQRVMAKSQQQMATLTVTELIIEQNLESADSLQRTFYTRAAKVAKGANYPGADMTTAWYDRNFHIYANIASTIERPDERVLVLIGAGHTAFLRDFVRAAGEWTLVDPKTVLR